MPVFTIETTYQRPVFRQRLVEAETLDQACRLAAEDDDWSDGKEDYDCAGATYVSGAWEGPDAAYGGAELPFSEQFQDINRRKADHFEALLGILKSLAHGQDLSAPDLPSCRPDAESAIAKAEAILAGALDPTARPGDVFNRTHVLVRLDEARVYESISSILETDPDLAHLAPNSISAADIHAACLAVAASIDLSEERGAAEFRAALQAIREAQRRPPAA